MQRLGLLVARNRYVPIAMRPMYLANTGTSPLFRPVEPKLSIPHSRPIVSRAAKEVAKRPTLAAKAASRVPKFMSKYAKSLTGAPISHITAFLLLHEVTAVGLLFGLWQVFNVFDYTPTWIPDWVFSAGEDFIRKIGERNHWEWIEHADKTSKTLLHGIAAYAAVKATLPLRILFCFWAMPWTAEKVIQPISSFFGRITGFSKNNKNQPKDGDLPENLKQKKQPQDQNQE